MSAFWKGVAVLLSGIVLAGDAPALMPPLVLLNPWTGHVIPTFGPDDNVLSVAVARSTPSGWASGHEFYVAYEVEDRVAQTHVLYLQRWDGSFWPAPVTLGASYVPILSNPSIATSPGHVTVMGHEEMSNGCQALKEYDYDTATGAVDATRIVDDGDEVATAGCEDVGHSQLAWSPTDSTYHVCWTRKEGGTDLDEVYCSKRAATALAWDPPEAIANGANVQDHATVAVGAAANRRIAYHDATTGIGDDAHDARLTMFRSGASWDYNTYRVPDGTAVPQPGKQERPFLALDGADKMHVAWEDGPTGSQVIKYARCLNSTPNGCNADLEWEFNNVAISQAAVSAHFPHLAFGYARSWISYQQELATGLNEVVVLHRCLSAPNSSAWTASDPYPADDRDEFTEEYGTPHIATRSLGLIDTPLEVGTVTLREILGTGRYAGVLYTRSEPICN